MPASASRWRPATAPIADQLLKNADMALYGAKADGRGTYRFFEPEMDARAKARRDAGDRPAPGASSDGEFEVHYQPLVDLDDDRISGCEALLRWQHPERGMISPAEFIPVAEETGLIMPARRMGAARRPAPRRRAGRTISRVAVNVSPVQFRSQTLALNGRRARWPRPACRRSGWNSRSPRPC